MSNLPARAEGRAPADDAGPAPDLVRLQVSASTVEDALRLIDALPNIHAELAPHETSYAVLVEVDGSASGQLARTLARIDRWRGGGPCHAAGASSLPTEV